MPKYELESLKLPKLIGWPLILFTRALENSITRALLLPGLLKQVGLPKLRQARIDEPPTMRPLGKADITTESIPYAQQLAQLADDLPANSLPTPFTTIRDYARAYRNGTLTPEGVAEQVLAAIKQSDTGDQPLRAFIATHRDDLMAQARASAERIEAGKPLSILDGVPVAIKDEIDQVPYPTTVGTRFMGKTAVNHDATTVARLRKAGALLIGKTNMHEIGINPTGLNRHYGVVRNPYNLAHDSGGSSSGSAAAVAAGICPVAMGADGGGSVRIPAALCGVVGLKATFGRISEHGAAPLCWSVAHLGPIGATVADVALVYAAIAGPDQQDVVTLKQPAVSLKNWRNPDLTGIRLGVYRPWFEHATPDIVAANEAMLQKLVEAGATIKEIEIPWLDEMRIAHSITILSEMSSSMNNYPDNRHDFGNAVRVNLALGRTFSAGDYVQSQRMRTRAMAVFAKLYTQVDVIVTPATAITAPPIPTQKEPHDYSDLSTVIELMRYVIPGNLVGLPALSLPVGYDSSGLPIGMQLMGNHWTEALLLRLGNVIEQGVARKRPSLFCDLQKE